MQIKDLPDGPVAETAPRPTLERWLTGTRFSALPTRGATHPPPMLSFEFFPPKTEALEQQLWTCIRRLEPLQPRFVSVTYGAGGSTRQRTHTTVTRIVRETGLVPAAHLTCVNTAREGVDEVAQQYLGGGGSPHSRAARRRSAGGELPASSTRLSVCCGSRGGTKAHCSVRHLGGGLSRSPPTGVIANGRY